jgi:hypothetical protein
LEAARSARSHCNGAGILRFFEDKGAKPCRVDAFWPAKRLVTP